VFPLADGADEKLRKLAKMSGSAAIAQLSGASLLAERAVLANSVIPGRVSAGGGCRLFDALGDTIAFNLARPDDRNLLSALFETDALDESDDEAIAARIKRSDADSLVKRGRSMGLAIARENERPPCSAIQCEVLVSGLPGVEGGHRAPKVLDLSALWAGPLASHLL
jgi:hypothetical protein